MPMLPFWVRPVEKLLDSIIDGSRPGSCIGQLIDFMKGFGMLPSEETSHAALMATAFQARENLKLLQHKELFTIAVVSQSSTRFMFDDKKVWADRICLQTTCWLIWHARFFKDHFSEILRHYFDASYNDFGTENVQVLVACLTSLRGPLERETVDDIAFHISFKDFFEALHRLPWQSMSFSLAQVMATAISAMDEEVKRLATNLLETNLFVGFMCIILCSRVSMTCAPLMNMLWAALDFAIEDPYMIDAVITTGAWQLSVFWPLSHGRYLLQILNPVLICDPCDFSPEVAASSIAADLQRWSPDRRAWISAVIRRSSLL